MAVRITFLLFIAIFAASCAQTNTTTSRGESSDVSIDEVFTDANRTGPLGAATQTNNDNNIAALPGIDKQSFQDFDAFKSWLRARQPGTSEFMEFQLWREYLEYVRVTSQ